MDANIAQITEAVKDSSAIFQALQQQMEQVIVGQRYMLERLLIGLLSNGHILLEGVPGLAKTTTVKTLARCIQTNFKRIQFTPDLLPADIVGTQVYEPKTGNFSIKRGPIFNNIILADEINRAPAKVQSALLEAMQERQVTIGDTTFPLDDPFLVLATQNPIEQEGTYPLPEAQVDRFMLKIRIGYPSKKDEREIVDRVLRNAEAELQPVLSPMDLAAARKVAESIYIDDKVKDYIVDIVFASRDPKAYKLDIAQLISFGASPRASICLTQAAKAHAFLRGRGYVTPQDVKSVGVDVLRHRIILSYEAEAEDVKPEDIVARIFDKVEVP